MRRICSAFLHTTAITSKRSSARNADETGSTSHIKIVTPHERRITFLEILTVCQIIVSFLIVIMLLLNLLLTDHDKALWSTLVGAGFGYLVPNSRLKHASNSSSHDEDEWIHDVVAKNSSMDLYPSNMLSQWKTKLSEFVELEDKWEVEL